MQAVSVIMPRGMAATARMATKEVISADITDINNGLIALNGEDTGGTPLDKIAVTETSKTDIKAAIEAYAVDVDDAPLSEYAGLIEDIGAGVEATFKTVLDAANEEASADLTAGIALVDNNYAAIKAAVEVKGIDMTDVIPSNYAEKITELAINLSFCFNDSSACIEAYSTGAGGASPVVPASIRGITVSKIGQSRDGVSFEAFRALPLKLVRLPDQPLILYLTCFYNCGLKSMFVPAGSDVGNVTFGVNNIAFCKLGANVTIFSETSISAYSGLKALYNGAGAVAGNFVYTAGTWKRVENCTDTFSMENAPLDRLDYVDIFNLLQVVVGKSITLTGGYGLPYLTPADKAIATAKGWTLIE